MYIVLKNGERIYIDLTGYDIESVHKSAEISMKSTNENAVFTIKGYIFRCDDIIYFKFDDEYDDILDAMADNEFEKRMLAIGEQREKHDLDESVADKVINKIGY